MNPFVRKLFPYLVILFGLASLAWAVSFGTLPPADFTFNNEDEVKTVDPSKAAGTPEHRVLDCLYEGLLRLMPATTNSGPDGNVPLVVAPGVAELPERSADGKVYTFHLRDTARWSNGDPVTAHDFAWAWRRTLHPDTASEYAYQLHYLAAAQKYNEAKTDLGDRVEVELADRRDSIQPFPRGTIVRGALRAVVKPAPPEIGKDVKDAERGRIEAGWRKQWVYLVEEHARGADGKFVTDWNAAGKLAAFSAAPPDGEWQHSDVIAYRGRVEKCERVLVDFDSNVGARAIDDHTLIVTLKNPTPFFAELCTFYPLFPTNRKCVEQFGAPAWTKPKNIVTNGPYLLQARRIRDRIRLAKNPYYWDAEHVQIGIVDALPIKSRITGTNMFLNGELDWMHSPPGTLIPDLKKRKDFVTGPALLTYFFRLNTQRKPLDDKRVRQALNQAMDKQAICQYVTLAGETPARSLVPLGMPNYSQALCGEYSPEQARQLLAEAGFPDGQGFPKLEILFNSDEMHRSIAEVIQQQWKKNLGVNIDLRGIAWPAYLEAMHRSDFDICRAGWVPDYTDPNTFLDMFITDGLQNATHWGNPKYDELIAAAAAESDVAKRMQFMHDAEAILMDELPILPAYYYVTKNLVKPRLVNFSPNLQDLYPIYALRVNDRAPAAMNRN